MAQVFISYSRVDTAFVDLFIKRLQRAFPDLNIWHDQSPHGLIGGDNWWQAILDAIAASDVFIYILSNESIRSVYCQAEFTEARRLQKRIITVQARDKTELTDDLDDIQFINMKDGVDSPDAIPGLVAAINLRLKQAEKYRHVRPLWKPATPRPTKEVPLIRPDHAPDVTTPALSKPLGEIEGLQRQRAADQQQTWLVLLGIGVTLVVTLLAAFIGLIPWLTERAETAATQDAQNTFAAQTQVAALTPPAATTTPTLSLTPTATLTITPTPTITATPDIIAAAQTVIAQQTAQAIVDASTATAAHLASQTAFFLTRSAEETATATLWTATPTVNFTASVEAILTQWAHATATQQARDLTATATLWTATPTATYTPSNTPDATATLIAFRPQTNADWTPIERDFDGVTMVLVPAGCFMMGSPSAQSDEQPVHEQCFDAPFWLDETEVTQVDFERLDGWKANTNVFDSDQRPVENITWFEAHDFCARRSARLSTEAEWEYAARGPDNLVYPWGDAWNANNAVWDRNSNSQTAHVGSHPAGASWVGALDMAGNVWEWTSSLYEAYPYDAADGREADTDSRTDVTHGQRGGAFESATVSLRAANRGRSYPGNRSSNVGFRCARDF